MFYREDLGITLADLNQSMSDRDAGSSGVRVSPDEVEFHLDAADPVVKVKDREVPAEESTLDRIAGFLSIPSAFNTRLRNLTSAETQNRVYTEILSNTVRKDMEVRLGSAGISDIFEWGRTSVRPHQITHAMMNAMGEVGPSAKIARLVDEPSEFSFDAYVDSTDFNIPGIGGDRAQGDITAGGLRTGINLKQGLAPWVQPFSFRLACTNGMETMRNDLKVDARGQSVEEVIAEIEEMARLAFGGVESTIAHFYEMREQEVENPERVLRAIARERKIPDRSLVTLLDLAAGEDLPDSPTMFDVVNLVTNLANAPQIRNDGGRLLLERAGGAVVTDHAARCGHCQQRVSH